MKNKIFFSTILFAIVLIGSVLLLYNNRYRNQTILINNVNLDSNQIILYYGIGCPHCAIVEEFISENEIAKKINFIQKEIYYNAENSQELINRAKICGIADDLIGVPMLWDGEKCYSGDQPIIDFFTKKLIQD